MNLVLRLNTKMCRLGGKKNSIGRRVYSKLFHVLSIFYDTENIRSVECDPLVVTIVTYFENEAEKENSEILDQQAQDLRPSFD